MRVSRYLSLLLVALVVSVAPAQASIITVSNTSAITIQDLSVASPYPSTISVSGVSEPIIDVTLTINGLSHTAPIDLAALLVGPAGQTVLLFDGSGNGSASIQNLILTFADSAAATLPDNGTLTSGTYRPGQDQFGDTLSPPAPALPYGTAFSVFNGLSANGTWSLFVQDFGRLDVGSISGGWSLTITTAEVPVPEPASITLLGLGLAGMGVRRWRQRKT